MILVLVLETLCICVAGPWEVGRIHLNLSVKHTITLLSLGLLAEVFNHLDDSLRILVDSNHIVVLNHDLLIVFHNFVPIALKVIDFAQLANVLEEFVCCTRQLGLKESQPEYLSSFRPFKKGNNLLSKVVVQNILEIDKIKLVGPWMKHREALMTHVLSSELANVLLDEQEVSLISLYRVAQVILQDHLLRVS